MSRRSGGARAAFRLLDYFRPYIGRLLFAAALTIVAGACEGGQAFLLQPLLDRVLLKSADSEDDEGDIALRDTLLAAVPNASAAIAAQEKKLPAAPVGRLKDTLAPMGGRTAGEVHAKDQVAQILERSRRVLLNAERGVNADEEGWLTTFKEWMAKDEDPEAHRNAARKAVAEAARKQLAAEQLLGVALPTADPTARALAAHFSFEARGDARVANFDAAWSDLLPILGLAILAGVVLAFARYFHTLIARVVVILITRDMQVDLVKHVLSLSTAQIGVRSRGELLSRLTADHNFAVKGVIAPVSTTLISRAIRLLIFLGFAIVIAPKLCFILIGLAATVMIPVRYAGKRIRRGARSRTSALADVTETIYQMFSGIRIVKVFQRESFERKRLRERTDKAYVADLRIAFARLASSAWLILLNNASIPLVLVLGGYLIVHRMWGLEAGSFVVFAALILLMYRPAKSLASAYNDIQAGLPSAQRLIDLFDEVPAIVDAEDAVEFKELSKEIRVENLRFSYGEREVLRDISFIAPAGTTTAIVGHTGSGKSTLIDLLARYMDPTEGTIFIDEVPLQKLRLSSYLDRLAVVSQGTFLFNDTIRANIRYGRLDATDTEIEEAAKAARVHQEIMGLEGGYDCLAGEMGGRLSGGQAQRVTIARAIVKHPKILLLDEAMSALDTKTERLVQEAIDELGKACTLFVIAHRLSTVRDAEQILVLHDGELVERGTHSELAGKGGHYSALLAHMQDDEE